MCDSSANTIVEMTRSQSQYWKYRFGRRLAHWKLRQDYLIKNIERMKERIIFHKKKADYYEGKLYEYESYIIVLNPVGEQIVQVRSDAANRLQEAIQEVGEDESDGESELLQDDDSHSVSTCDTLREMRNVFHSRTGRK
jgi:hypothetical protein